MACFVFFVFIIYLLNGGDRTRMSYLCTDKSFLMLPSFFQSVVKNLNLKVLNRQRAAVILDLLPASAPHLPLWSPASDFSASMNAGYEQPKVLTDLSEVELALILDFCAIAQVFRCKSVSREWHAVAQFVIKSRKSLAVVKHGDNDWRLRHFPLNTVRVTTKSGSYLGTTALIRAFNQMRGLKHVYIGDDETCAHFTMHIVLANSERLERLWIPVKLPSYGWMPIPFPRLRELQCASLSVKAGYACPQLKELTITRRSIPKQCVFGKVRESPDTRAKGLRRPFALTLHKDSEQNRVKHAKGCAIRENLSNMTLM